MYGEFPMTSRPVTVAHYRTLSLDFAIYKITFLYLDMGGRSKKRSERALKHSTYRHGLKHNIQQT